MQAVADRILWLATALGVGLGACMALGAKPLIAAFTSDASARSAMRHVFPVVVLTQPLNALAFVWDGVLYGAGGFAYAARVMPVCALPACACMLASLTSHVPDVQLGFVWGGLTLLMIMRSLTVWVPFRLGRSPFDGMSGSSKAGGQQQKRPS